MPLRPRPIDRPWWAGPLATAMTTASMWVVTATGTVANREGRSTGRPAPAGDPAKAGAQMGGVAMSFPLFSPGPSRAQRMRDSLLWKQNEPVRRRLQARLDSVQREQARTDSVRALAIPP